MYLGQFARIPAVDLVKVSARIADFLKFTEVVRVIYCIQRRSPFKRLVDPRFVDPHFWMARPLTIRVPANRPMYPPSPSALTAALDRTNIPISALHINFDSINIKQARYLRNWITVRSDMRVFHRIVVEAELESPASAIPDYNFLFYLYRTFRGLHMDGVRILCLKTDALWVTQRVDKIERIVSEFSHPKSYAIGFEVLEIDSRLPYGDDEIVAIDGHLGGFSPLTTLELRFNGVVVFAKRGSCPCTRCARRAQIMATAHKVITLFRLAYMYTY
jgi:hypothetical protein